MRTPDELPPLPAARRPDGADVDRGPGGRPGRRGGGLVRLRRAQHDAGPLHLRLLHVQQEGGRQPEGEAVRRQAQLPAGNGRHVEEDEARISNFPQPLEFVETLAADLMPKQI